MRRFEAPGRASSDPGGAPGRRLGCTHTLNGWDMIQAYTPGSEDGMQALVKKVFDDFVGHEYPPEGNEDFY